MNYWPDGKESFFTKKGSSEEWVMPHRSVAGETIYMHINHSFEFVKKRF